MKVTITIVFLLLTGVVLGQIVSDPNLYDEPLNWKYQDFIKNNATRFTTFSYSIKKNGKDSQRKTLIINQTLQKDINKVSGIRPVQLQYNRYRSSFFTEYYNDRGLLIAKVDGPKIYPKKKIQPFKEIKYFLFHFKKWFSWYKFDHSVEAKLPFLYKNIDSTTYDYTTNNDVKKEASWVIQKRAKDDSICATQTQTITLDYNNNNQVVKRSEINDSIKYFLDYDIPFDIHYKGPFKHGPSQFTLSNKYDREGKLIETRDTLQPFAGWFTVHVFDDKHSLVSITNYSIGTDSSITFEDSTNYKYVDSFIVKKDESPDEVEQYDLNGNLVRRILYQDTINYSYGYTNNKLTSITAVAANPPKKRSHFDITQTDYFLSRELLSTTKLKNCCAITTTDINPSRNRHVIASSRQKLCRKDKK